VFVWWCCAKACSHVDGAPAAATGATACWKAAPGGQRGTGKAGKQHSLRGRVPCLRCCGGGCCAAQHRVGRCPCARAPGGLCQEVPVVQAGQVRHCEHAGTNKRPCQCPDVINEMVKGSTHGRAVRHAVLVSGLLVRLETHLPQLALLCQAPESAPNHPRQ
jgi:hypothetical protein